MTRFAALTEAQERMSGFRSRRFAGGGSAIPATKWGANGGMMDPPPDLSGPEVSAERLELHARATLQTFGLFMNAEAKFAPADSKAAVDAFLFAEEMAVGVAEVKVRVKYTLPELHQHGGIYPIPEARLDRLRQVASGVGLPAFLVVRLRDGTLWYWEVRDRDGVPLAYGIREKMGRRFALLKLADATMWAQFGSTAPETERLLSQYRVAKEMGSLG